MSRVLVVDPNAGLMSAVARCLREVGLDVVGHTHVEAAQRCLREERFDLALVDSSVRAVLDLGRQHTVVMDSYPGAEAELQLARRQTLLHKPFTSVELLSLLRQELGSFDLPHASLIVALQAAHAGRKSACLVLHDQVEPAEVFVIGGEIYDARRGGLRGESALRALLEGTVEVVATPPIEICHRTIHRAFSTLMLDILTQIEDAELMDAWSTPFAEDEGST